MSIKNISLIKKNKQFLMLMRMEGLSLCVILKQKKYMGTIFANQENKQRRVNIRLSERDYLKAQEIAMREGIPSATLFVELAS